MTTTELLSTVQAAGIAFEVHGGSLRCKPKPTGELLVLIRANKAELMALSIATLTADLPHEPTLWAKLHRLLDQADELDRAGDRDGMVRILDDIGRLISNSTPAQKAMEAPRTGKASYYGAAAATAQPRTSNAESSRMSDSARVRAGEGVRI